MEEDWGAKSEGNGIRLQMCVGGRGGGGSQEEGDEECDRSGAWGLWLGSIYFKYF